MSLSLLESSYKLRYYNRNINVIKITMVCIYKNIDQYNDVVVDKKNLSGIYIKAF